MSKYEDEDYFLPLEDQRVFGAGITRKRVPFVRSSDHELSTLTSSAPSTPSGTGASIANAYLSIVMSKSSSSTTSASDTSSKTASASATTEPTTATDTNNDRSHSAPPNFSNTICEVCNLPLAASETESRSHKPHESSLAHQVCLAHSHPPSHLDRTSHGLRYLESYGWDPDSRVGLGAEGREGIRVPVKGKMKADTVGLGAVIPSSAAVEKRGREKDKVQKLNAKQVRKGHYDARRKGDKLRELFYQDEEVLRHLGAS
ncbi:putative G-patch domain protein [Aspergillus undulatus]|uniref:putative G-patch domain protein n=1 Tax=Aspergillus undulatus TaxID=1810928 RepID=UPI003CCCB539